MNWIPIRRGAVYCSSACGYGCLRSSYIEAGKKAKALAEKLGPDWKPRVWENLGWHWCVVSKNNLMSVYPPSHGGTDYWIDFHPAYVRHQYHLHAKTPKAGIEAIYDAFFADLEKVNDMIGKLPTVDT